MRDSVIQYVISAGFGAIWFGIGYSVGWNNMKSRLDKMAERIVLKIKESGVKIIGDFDPLNPDTIEMFDKQEQGSSLDQ